MAPAEICGVSPEVGVQKASVASSGNKRKKCLIFKLGNFRFALDILSVEDISPINWSVNSHGTSWPTICGRVVPVLDLRCEAGYKEEEGKKDNPEERERYFVLVVQIESRQRRFAIGLVVDRVAEILDLDAEDRVLPTLIRLDEHVAGLGAVCAN
ncbi:MAG: chemotaxis protein CheW [Planctomycetota bacterium]